MHDLSLQAETSPQQPFQLVNPDGLPGFLVLCDHASNALPDGYGTLGLPPAEFGRHIAWDIGAAGVARHLSALLDCPAVLARFSRLLVDLNRGEDDPTIVMKLSDGAIVPGNRDVDAHRDAAEFAHRIAAFHAPYHDAVESMIARARGKGAVPILISVHSFTPRWRGNVRPWHTGILWDKDGRLPVPLIAALRAEGDIVVGDNEPYTGRLKNDCLYRHATMHGLPHALIEIRQDLIETEEGQAAWAARYARHLAGIAAMPGLRDIRHFGSHADPALPVSP
ncbi:N-formylglutamate amidohydrolase [Parvibaculum sp.]|uniref:N-formylglutamate amidohydrolase n=1 Tax=Parvibaculum sp. TaxID=2024848 RepID=UPI00272F3AD5|nr:N-formylglutamate amidohydrolase [Parvibaculum sp.]MDP1628494.1 N-formylglutamate amidohydrolase [Parvibaculum sp.]MDP2151826.1 N-formylglutamate amidohydrolase [Parvibaculum sp.]MDP3326949.1 N-formylglutamate amidohydrolase [Parvibaculum sp.]